MSIHEASHAAFTLTRQALYSNLESCNAKGTTTNRMSVTITGEAVAHRATTKKLLTRITGDSANAVMNKQFSYITSTRTATTIVWTISSLCVRDATKSKFIIAPAIFQRRLYSNQSVVLCVEQNSSLLVLEALSAMTVFQGTSSNEESRGKERRYSQRPQQCGITTLNYGKGERLLAEELKLAEKHGPAVRKRIERERPGSDEEYIQAAIQRKARKEAGKIIHSYFDQIPGVKYFIDATHIEAAKTKFVQSILGRRRWLLQIMDIEEQMEHEREAISQNRKACWCRRCSESRGGDRRSVNTIIQGSAADICMAAMIKCHFDPALSNVNMLFQVHDEINFEVDKHVASEAAKRVQYHMEHPGISMRVPLRAEPAWGANWTEAH